MVGIVLVSHSAGLARGLAQLAGQVAGRGDGVVVLADLGSAILTVRSVLEHENGVRARLADAPFVEGAVAAAVIAAAGQPLEEVIRSAEEVRGASKL